MSLNIFSESRSTVTKIGLSENGKGVVLQVPDNVVCPLNGQITHVNKAYVNGGISSGVVQMKTVQDNIELRFFFLEPSSITVKTGQAIATNTVIGRADSRKGYIIVVAYQNGKPVQVEDLAAKFVALEQNFDQTGQPYGIDSVRPVNQYSVPTASGEEDNSMSAGVANGEVSGAYKVFQFAGIGLASWAAKKILVG